MGKGLKFSCSFSLCWPWQLVLPSQEVFSLYLLKQNNFKNKNKNQTKV